MWFDMDVRLDIVCPCGSGKSFKHCCFGNKELPESVEKYQIVSEVLAQTVELGSGLLDAPDFQYFCNNGVDQFRLLMDYNQDKFEDMLNSNIGCQLVMEWLLFLAPLARTIEELNEDQQLNETSFFLSYLSDSEEDLVDITRIEVSDSHKKSLDISVCDLVKELLKGLSRSRLSVFYKEDDVINGLCLKDAVTGERHYLYDEQLFITLSKSEILVGRIVHSCNLKSLLSVYGLPPGDKPRAELISSCEKWHSLIESDKDFSVSDMQVNLLKTLADYLV